MNFTAFINSVRTLLRLEMLEELVYYSKKFYELNYEGPGFSYHELSSAELMVTITSVMLAQYLPCAPI